MALTDILLHNKIDTLQSTYESIYWGNPDLNWKRSAMEYLAAFPCAGHQQIFRAILQDEEESKGSDYYAQVFLTALSMIKGAKTKAFIAQY